MVSGSPTAAETAACVAINTYAVDALNHFQTGLKVTVTDETASQSGDFHFFRLEPTQSLSRIAHPVETVTVSRKITSVQRG
ncbi:hypothetical protein CP557_11650 [Natrinema ejinorense]|uniref:Uncharacterized protein n=1 Tax=Natrinema ejinorense TaxID=373386 RepID=A0A2A5QW96_9EURY|nr:hypothetical protein CP557_11650 [Natrinema ejinorense]